MSMARRLLVSLVWGVAGPAMAADCGATVANLLLARQFDQAIGYFQTPSGPLKDSERTTTVALLKNALELSGAGGSAKPTETPPSGLSRKLRIGYAPPNWTVQTLRRATYAVESKEIPGLLMSVHLPLDAQLCAVYTIELESYDAVGMNKVQTLLGHLVPAPAASTK